MYQLKHKASSKPVQNDTVGEYIGRPFVPSLAYFKFIFRDGSIIECLKDETPYWILKKKYTNIKNCSANSRYILEFDLVD